MGSKLHIERLQSCLLRPGDKKSQKSQFYELSMWFHRVLGSKPPIFQYLQGLGPEQESNVLPILAGKGDKNQDPYLEGVKTRFSLILRADPDDEISVYPKG